MNRQKFIEFLGLGVVGLALPISVLGTRSVTHMSQVSIKGVLPSFEDDVLLAQGLNYKKIISWNQSINETQKFGSHNDYIAFLPKGDKEALLWVNHEYFDELFVSGKLRGEEKSKAEIEKERLEVGGSIIKLKRKGDNWSFIQNDSSNRRLDGTTSIPFAKGAVIKGKSNAQGTLANCSGGVTPWGTILTCEENYDMYYGERAKDGTKTKSAYGWEKYFDNPPEHYGWVVEVNCDTGKAIKHTSLGRCCHECATVLQTKEKKTVVYTGDDMNNECLYKFIASGENSLEEGELFVASLESGKWVSLDIEKQPLLKNRFGSHLEVMINLREASKLVGGTPLDRPEDIDVDPITGAVFISLTNNVPKGNHFGSILKIVEKEDYDSLSFEHEVFLAGGVETGFACPDNMAFDPKGNLWFTSDISGSTIGKGKYSTFKNNGLFIVPREGEQKGEVIQMASAPKDAEFTGPCFTPDGKTLFLSVQHPGETTRDINLLSSNWPDGGDAIPKSSVIAISGEFFD